MVDITCCRAIRDDKECPLKDNCYRYKAKWGEYQSVFSQAPFKENKCSHHWPIKKEIKNNEQINTENKKENSGI